MGQTRQQMIFLRSTFFKKYLLPGFVFQSVIIAGGYGTGRELVEYFLNYGPLGGLLGMFLISMLMWSVIMAVTFEFARKFKAYDYRTFFMRLLGRFWFLFEVLYIIYLFIVLAVIGSAAGVILRDNFGLPYLLGVMIMLAGVGFLTFKGSRLIENFLSLWSMVLYFIYIIFFVVALTKFGPAIQQNLASGTVLPGWAVSAFKYAFYNLATIAAVLFCLNHIETRREAVVAGLLCGPIGILPAFLFFTAVLGHYPEVLPVEIPAVYVLQRAGLPALLGLFQVMLFGTLIETGTGMIHSVNERIHATLQARGKELPRQYRPLVASAFLLVALGISTYGLITLIAKGYGTASWGFLVVYILPLMTLGLYKIVRAGRPSRR